MGDAVVEQEEADRLGWLGEEMQADLAVLVGGPGEHRADEARLEALQEAHRPHRGAAQLREVARLGVGAEQTLIRRQSGLDLLVAGQLAHVAQAQALHCLALGELEIADSRLAHEAGGFLGDALARVPEPPVAACRHDC